VCAALLAALASRAPTQQPIERQFQEVVGKLPHSRDGTTLIALGDVDGDGDLDMLTNSFPVGRCRLYTNNGDGGFSDASAQLPADPVYATCAVLADVDRDGDLDAIVGDAVGVRRLFRNDGTGVFSDVTATDMPNDGARTNAFALGDIDGDGDLDLVSANDGQNFLYVNVGPGVFRDATAGLMPVDTDFTNSVALGDVDGDGDLDLVCGNGGLGRNRLYLNTGGAFIDATAGRIPFINDYTSSLALGDVDADGDLDLLCSNEGGHSRLYLNNGLGVFTDATATRMPAINDYSSAIALGDVDGDGDFDLVLASGTPQNRLYLNDGTGRFTDATTRLPSGTADSRAIVLGDLDADGDLDLVLAVFGQGAIVHLNQGATFVRASRERLPMDGDMTLSLCLRDLDGDGDLDLLCGNAGSNRLYRNDGRATFTDATTGNWPSTPDPYHSCIAVGDVDGDGDLDVLQGRYHDIFVASLSCSLYLNNGAARFTDVSAARMPQGSDQTMALALGDVDGDGDLDIVCGNSGQSRLYLNQGTGTFLDATSTRLPADNAVTTSVALGDVDGDGDLDILFGDSVGRLYLNNGQGVFTDVTAARLPANTILDRALALGDIDGDGDLDIVGAAVLRNDGTGTFVDSGQTIGNPAAVALGDVDGDGDLDVVAGYHVCRHGACIEPAQNRLFLNDGTGALVDATARLPDVLDATFSLALGDIDGDGDLDIVFGNYPNNRFYVNLLHQLDSPYLLRIGRQYQLDAYARYGPPRILDFAVPYVSTGTASIPLPPYGIVGIDPGNLIQLPGMQLSPTTGFGSTRILVPNTTALDGLAIFGQALLVQYPGQSQLSNVTADVMLR
jgi:hypothetical protein